MRERLTNDTSSVIVGVMKEVSAVDLRQSLGRVAKSLERDGEPILLTLGGKPVGVIVSLKDFEERFALEQARAARAELIEEILGDRRKGAVSVDKALTDLRR